MGSLDGPLDQEVILVETAVDTIKRLISEKSREMRILNQMIYERELLDEKTESLFELSLEKEKQIGILISKLPTEMQYSAKKAAYCG